MHIEAVNKNCEPHDFVDEEAGPGGELAVVATKVHDLSEVAVNTSDFKLGDVHRFSAHQNSQIVKMEIFEVLEELDCLVEGYDAQVDQADAERVCEVVCSVHDSEEGENWED